MPERAPRPSRRPMWLAACFAAELVFGAWALHALRRWDVAAALRERTPARFARVVVRGRLADERGVPFAHAPVRFLISNGSARERTFGDGSGWFATDADGRYECWTVCDLDPPAWLEGFEGIVDGYRRSLPESAWPELPLPGDRVLVRDATLPRWPREDPLALAERVWRQGAEGFRPAQRDGAWSREDLLRDDPWDAPSAAEFPGIDGQTLDFLRSPTLGDATGSFSCVPRPTEHESALRSALRTGTPERKLQALATLLRVRSPASATEQLQALGELEALPGRPAWRPLLAEWRREFAPARLTERLGAASNFRTHWTAPPVGLWAVCAAGAAQATAAVPRLAELAGSADQELARAAVASLAAIPGAAAEQALSALVLGGTGHACIPAAYALRRRNPPALEGLPQRAAPEQRDALEKLVRKTLGVWHVQQPD